MNCLRNACLPACLFATLLPHATAGAEPVAVFAEALRQRGYHDIVFAYLDQIADSRIISADAKASLPFERAVTWIDLAAKEQPDGEEREKLLARADEELTKFLARSDANPRWERAKSLQAKLTLERARAKVARANNPFTTADERSQWMAEARKYYDQAREQFQKLAEERKEQREQIQRLYPNLRE